MVKKSKLPYFTKSELINEIARKHRLKKTLAEVAVNSVLESISTTLEQGNRVEVRGFGTFELRKYGSYQGRNPQTGELIRVKSKKLPFFKAGKFKEEINKSRKKSAS